MALQGMFCEAGCEKAELTMLMKLITLLMYLIGFMPIAMGELCLWISFDGMAAHKYSIAGVLLAFGVVLNILGIVCIIHVIDDHKRFLRDKMRNE
jgi:hypothetical protein